MWEWGSKHFNAATCKQCHYWIWLHRFHHVSCVVCRAVISGALASSPGYAAVSVNENFTFTFRLDDISNRPQPERSRGQLSFNGTSANSSSQWQQVFHNGYEVGSFWKDVSIEVYYMSPGRFTLAVSTAQERHAGSYKWRDVDTGSVSTKEVVVIGMYQLCRLHEYDDRVTRCGLNITYITTFFVLPC